MLDLADGLRGCGERAGARDDCADDDSLGSGRGRPATLWTGRGGPACQCDR